MLDACHKWPYDEAVSASSMYLLTIKEKNHSWAGRSPVRSTHQTSEEAQAELESYVRRNWDAEIGIEEPTDPDELVEIYFEDADEQYSIRQQ